MIALLAQLFSNLIHERLMKDSQVTLNLTSVSFFVDSPRYTRTSTCRIFSTFRIRKFSFCLSVKVKIRVPLTKIDKTVLKKVQVSIKSLQFVHKVVAEPKLITSITINMNSTQNSTFHFSNSSRECDQVKKSRLSLILRNLIPSDALSRSFR